MPVPARAAASLGLTLPIRELPASLAGWDEAAAGRPPSIPPALRCRGTCLSAGSISARARRLMLGGCRHRSGAGGAHRRYRHRTAEQGSDAPAGIDYPGHTEITAARRAPGLRHDAGQRRAAGDPGFHSRFAAGRHRRGDRGKRAARVSSGANGLSGAGHSETAHCGGWPESAPGRMACSAAKILMSSCPPSPRRGNRVDVSGPGRAIPFSCVPGAGVRHCGRPISRRGPDPGEISRGGSRR